MNKGTEVRHGVDRAGTLAALVAAALFAASQGAAATAPRTNVLIILCDDLGYADVGFQGSKEIATPHLDRLAASGVRCTNGSVSHSFCSPTRAGMLTGRYQARFGHEFNPVYDPLDASEGLPLTERLLPQHLKGSGYRTGWVGKWHLGASPDHTPWRRGFDETYGFIGGGHAFQKWTPNGRQYTLPLSRNGQSLDEVPEHLTPAFGTEGADFVRRNRNEPWLLYMAFNAPHTPHQPTAEREARFARIANVARRRYLAQISLLDDAVGEITGALAETGQAQRTLVFFFSDNGGPVAQGASNAPLRGQKGQVYEGGVRVPFLVSWPGKLPGGKIYDRPVSSLDVVPTALAVAGARLPKERKLDGVNLIPFLTGGSKGEPHPHLFWRVAAGHAVRSGQWKLVRQKEKAPELYDLAADPSEATDVFATETEAAARLTRELDGWDRQLIAPVFLGSSVKNEDWGPGGANQRGKSNPMKKDP